MHNTYTTKSSNEYGMCVQCAMVIEHKTGAMIRFDDAISISHGIIWLPVFGLENEKWVEKYHNYKLLFICDSMDHHFLSS